MSRSIELSERDISEGRRMFRGRLYGRGFPRRFIEETGDDLFAEGQLEVMRLMARGTVIYSPSGLLAHCAWVRTMRLLRKEARAPHWVGLESVPEPAEDQPGPDEAVICGERDRAVREAIGILGPEERKLVEMVYFGGMKCRAAGRVLGLSQTTAHRRHKAALRRLRPFFEKAGLDQ